MLGSIPPHIERWRHFSGVVFLLLLVAGLAVLHPITVESIAANPVAIAGGVLVGLGFAALDRRDRNPFSSHNSLRGFLVGALIGFLVISLKDIAPALTIHLLLGWFLVAAAVELQEVLDDLEDESPNPAT